MQPDPMPIDPDDDPDLHEDIDEGDDNGLWLTDDEDEAEPGDESISSSSDSEYEQDDGGTRQKPYKYKVPRGPDILYDPIADELDEQWMARLQNSVPTGRPSSARRTTDATLTCPMCFSILCLDCQRHDRYHNQFRAMFVQNCRVVTTERLRFQGRGSVSKQRSRKPPSENSADSPSGSILCENTYHPVRCSVCETEVAVYDHEEVFHFFNAIAS
ncbi:E2F-associated phosphoprotein-domain-containing protein [Polychytrium aggregatum]|uniref:E2F-associated phosphoprotein-domain-containing protein n=1 Tax=Polychytrium aggregatum TaxID=110093 RepID=UPI0022FE0A3A|nr:E2F-associated phosphoprotein-domain-containing protein [Polychytrium aggregatum]KAI9209552.1 E2F-associated phosphoprotein-domain-containing protein [Polychytrium aggregatum]